MKSLRTTQLIGIVVLAFTASLGGCSNKTASPPKSRPLSVEEAGRLAGSLVTNARASGAVFDAHSSFVGTQPQQSIDLHGAIDWAHLVGQANVHGNGPDTGLTKVVWTPTVIYERRPNLDQVISGLGAPSEAWISRPYDVHNRQLDRLLLIVLNLATEQAENATLLAQNEGSAFVRADRLRDTDVDVMRFGAHNTYWIEKNSDRMLRFEGNNNAGNAPTLVDLLSQQKLSLTPPPSEMTITSYSIKDLYESVTSRS